MVVSSFLVSPPQAAQPKGNSKCSGEVNSPSAKILLAQNACTAQKRRFYYLRDISLVTRHSARFFVSPPQAAQPKGNSKCSGEVNPTSAKILRRKMLVRRKSAAPCPHMKFANTDAPATVSNPATTIDRPLIAPSTSPSSMALAVPSACADEPMLTPFAMGSVI